MFYENLNCFNLSKSIYSAKLLLISFLNDIYFDEEIKKMIFNSVLKVFFD